MNITDLVMQGNVVAVISPKSGIGVWSLADGQVTCMAHTDGSDDAKLVALIRQAERVRDGRERPGDRVEGKVER